MDVQVSTRRVIQSATRELVVHCITEGPHQEWGAYLSKRTGRFAGGIEVRIVYAHFPQFTGEFTQSKIGELKAWLKKNNGWSISMEDVHTAIEEMKR